MAEGGEGFEMDDINEDYDQYFEADDDDENDNILESTFSPQPQPIEANINIDNSLAASNRVLINQRVDEFYAEVKERTGYEPGIVDPSNFRIIDGSLYYHEWDGTNIRLSSKKGPYKFKSLSTIGKKKFIIEKLSITDYVSSKTKIIPSAQNIQAANNILTAAGEANINDLESIDTISYSIRTFEAESQTEGLNYRELAALDKKLQTLRGNLELNLAELSKLDDEIVQTKDELQGASSDEERSELSNKLDELNDLRSARITVVRENENSLKSQVTRIKESINRILDSDTTLAEKIRALFREQGVTIVSILAAFSLAISTIVSSIIAGVGGAGSAVPTPTPVPPAPDPGTGGVKDWIHRHLKNLANLLSKIGGKLLAVLPGILGSIASWIFNLLSKAVGFLADHVWAMIVGVATLIFFYFQKRLK